MSEDKLDRIAEDCAATRAHIINLKEYIQAVSNNVSEVRKELASHKESADAHGRKAGDRATSEILAWLGIVSAIGVGVVDYFRKK